MKRISASLGHPGHGVADNSKKIVVAHKRAGTRRFPQVFQQIGGRNGSDVPGRLDLPIEFPQRIGWENPHLGKKLVLKFLIDLSRLRAAVQAVQNFHAPPAQLLPAGL